MTTAQILLVILIALASYVAGLVTMRAITRTDALEVLAQELSEERARREADGVPCA